MAGQTENPVLLCQDCLVRLRKAITLSDGTRVPAGTLALLLPQTVAACIMTPEGESLAAVWDSISRSGHTHAEIAAYSEQLTRYADRLAAVETGLAQIAAAQAELAAAN